ncbi:MAG TPA: hypothetical protein VFT59_04165 [Candidatus Saccharimonadales bacterium]|nr:hypothetical protein [Candidatus Saccharimonadales bacterium]
MPRRIGLDVGGVIIDAIGNDNTDTAFRSDNYMATSAVEGAYKAVKHLVASFGADNIFIISKCGEVTEAKTRRWLSGNRFYIETGFNPTNLYFCRTRAEKAPIAARLRLTDFVDDRVDVLAYMKDIVERRYLFGPQLNNEQDTTGLFIANSWEDALTVIMHKNA